MSAQVHLTYDSTKGTASYSLTSGGTLTITANAKAENFQVVKSISMSCDAGQTRTATYGGQASVTFVSTGHTECSNINVNVIFGDDTSGEYRVSLGVSVAQGQGNVAGGGAYWANVGSVVSIGISAEPKPGWVFDHWRIHNNSGSIDRNVTSANYTLRWTVSTSILSNMFYAEAYFVPRYHAYVYAEHGYDNIYSNGGSSGVAGVVTVYYQDPFDGTRTTIARLRENKIPITVGQQVTVSCEIVDDDYKIIGWEVPGGHGVTSGTYTFTPEARDYTLRAVIVPSSRSVITVRVLSSLYGFFGRYVNVDTGYYHLQYFATKPKVYPDGSSEAGDANCSEMVISFHPTTNVIQLQMFLYRYHPPEDAGMTFAARNAFIHGASSPKVSIDESRYVTITDPQNGDDITIYLCTHMLVYDSGRSLVSRDNSLVCDCHKPSGGTFIEL